MAGAAAFADDEFGLEFAMGIAVLPPLDALEQAGDGHPPHGGDGLTHGGQTHEFGEFDVIKTHQSQILGDPHPGLLGSAHHPETLAVAGDEEAIAI